MGNLRQRARIQARLQTAPQYAALSEALGQAIADRNSAIHAAAGAAKGISGAINAAGPKVKAAYSDAQKSSAGSQALAEQSFASLGSGATPYAAAAAREKAVGEGVLASSMANALKDLSDRRINARAGQAYATQKALDVYASAADKAGSKRSSIAAQEGLIAANALGKMEQHQADQQFQAGQLATRLRSQAHISALGRRSSRINSVRSVRAQDRRQAASQSFAQSQQARGFANQGTLQAQRLAAQAPTAAGGKLLRQSVYSGRTKVLGAKSLYDQGLKSGKKLHEIAADARAHNVPEPIIGAGADLATRGYVTPANAQKLQQLGIALPPEWTGVVVRPHTRKRPGR